MIKLSIVVLTFNSYKFIGSCLDSVFAQDYPHFEVIIIDNGSEDGTINLIKNNFPYVFLIENKTNLGACIGRNQGIKIAKGEWILALDCDVVLEKTFLTKITNFINGLEINIGILQPKILSEDKKTIYSCGIYLSKLRRFYDIGKGKLDRLKYGNSKYIFGACSAAALYRRQMLEDIKEDTGYFDERFFFLVEDVDLSWRAQKKGWKAIFYPNAICYHYSNSSGYNFRLKQYLCFRNRYLLMLKNEKIRNLVKYIPFILIYDISRLFYLFFVNKYTLEALCEIIPIYAQILERRSMIKSKENAIAKA